MADTYYAIVVGSGFGGAVTACRLAQAGRSVCILERGNEWKSGFPRSILELPDAIWSRRRHSPGFIEFRFFDDIEIIQASAVGGGSVHYFNVSLRAPPSVFTNGRWPSDIDAAELSPYYALAEKALGVSLLKSTATGPAPFPPLRTRAFEDVCRAANVPPERVPLNVGFEPSADGCDYSGDCLLGCEREGGKGALSRNYLRLATTAGATIRPLCQVTHIEPLGRLGVDGYMVHFEDPFFDRRRPRRPGALHARQVILSAGTLGTTEILLRSREAGHFPDISPMLGERFSANGDMLFAGTLTNGAVDTHVGPSITSQAVFSERRFDITLQDCGIPDTLRALLRWTEGQEHFRFAAVMRLLRELTDDAPGRRAEQVAARSAESDEVFRPWKQLLTYLAMGTDTADGRIILDGDDVRVIWDNAANEPLYAAIDSLIFSISQSSGFAHRDSLWRRRGRAFTAHPLGGCVMADSADSGVVDSYGRIFATDGPGVYHNAYVADGSLIPSPLLANPSLTICALAERIAANMTRNCRQN